LANLNNSRFVAAMALRYGRGLRRFLFVHLRNVQDVPDLAQEVYLRLLRVNHQEAIRNPEAYLFTVAGHVVRQHLLRQSADTAFVDITEAIPELALPPGEEPQARVENAQRVEQFQKRILERLPRRVGAALVLHRIRGYTVQETAKAMGISCETVKQYLSDAAKRCRRTERGSGPNE
jgi:RNA polymerase sigma-70 factor (ECF subfamily)